MDDECSNLAGFSVDTPFDPPIFLAYCDGGIRCRSFIIFSGLIIFLVLYDGLFDVELCKISRSVFSSKNIVVYL